MRMALREVRCRACGIQIAARDAAVVTIRRGGMQATFSGQFEAAIQCYRCRELNLLNSTAEKN